MKQIYRKNRKNTITDITASYPWYSLLVQVRKMSDGDNDGDHDGAQNNNRNNQPPSNCSTGTVIVAGQLPPANRLNHTNDAAAWMPKLLKGVQIAHKNKCILDCEIIS